MRKEYEFREPGTLAILSDRAVNRPWGLMGGGEAAGSAHQIVRADGSRQHLPSKCVIDVNVGDRLVAETAGGGGYGDPTERTPEALAFDIEQGYTTN
jgi:N-methylhydantoinase B